ncbi:hypothetical protein ACOMHN_048245 [Nucella lapillus]
MYVTLTAWYGTGILYRISPRCQAIVVALYGGRRAPLPRSGRGMWSGVVFGQCANDYWLQLCSQIQIAADTGNIKAMYDGIKQALSPTQKKTTPLKSAKGEVIQDREQQMEHWVEHYTEIYARENVVTEDALSAIECLPELEELDREPTIDELSKALDSLASGKAPGKDGILAETMQPTQPRTYSSS